MPPDDRLDRSAKILDRSGRPRPDVVEQRLEHRPQLIADDPQHHPALDLDCRRQMDSAAQPGVLTLTGPKVGDGSWRTSCGEPGDRWGACSLADMARRGRGCRA